MDPRRVLVLLALLSALALGACGGDDESGSDPEPPVGNAVEDSGEAGAEGGQTNSVGPSGPSDEKLIESVIDSLLTSLRPAKVCGAATDGFLRRGYGDRAGCAAAVDPASQAKAVTVRRLEITGDTATAVAGPDGGVYDGERLDVVLVREGDAWKVDRLEADIPVGP